MSRDLIGFDRFLRRRWLDQAALLAAEYRDTAEVRTAMLQQVGQEIAGQEARLKTVGVLTRTWWRVPASHEALRDAALAQLGRVQSGDRLFLHWGMLLLAYPLFQQVVTIAGRLLRQQDALRQVQVSQRIAAEWGHRTTLDTAVPRIVRSLVDWGALQTAEDVGVYRTTEPLTARDADTMLWLVRALLFARGADMPFNDLVRAPALFPFALPVTPADLHQSPYFQVYQAGQEITMVAYESI